MAKKRKNRPQVPYSDPRGRTARAPAPEKKTAPERPATVESHNDYAYVTRDMRRIAILAAIIFAGQFALLYWMG